MNTISAQALHACKQAPRLLFNRPNVIACGLGYKVCQGEPTEEVSLIVSVVQKVPREQLAPGEVIPEEVNGMPTDVVEIGHVRALDAPDPKARYRPAQPGVSIGHPQVTAGTFGFLVERDGDVFILSNNHVLANRNAAKIGDPIYQPGPVDGGTASDRIAALADFNPLDFGEQPAQCNVAQTLARFINWSASVTGSSHRMEPIRVTPGENAMDAALARPDAADLVSAQLLGLGLPTGLAEPALGSRVQKMGRTTGLTQGTISQIHVTVNVDFEGKMTLFTDQVIATRMSGPGDSGSGILDAEGRAVGLLFAGSETVTLLTPLERILNHFRVRLIIAQP